MMTKPLLDARGFDQRPINEGIAVLLSLRFKAENVDVRPLIETIKWRLHQYVPQCKVAVHKYTNKIVHVYSENDKVVMYSITVTQSIHGRGYDVSVARENVPIFTCNGVDANLVSSVFESAYTRVMNAAEAQNHVVLS